MALLSLASINRHCSSRRGGTIWPLPHPRWNDWPSLVQILCKYWQLQWLHDHRGYGMTRRVLCSFCRSSAMFLKPGKGWYGCPIEGYAAHWHSVLSVWLAVNLCINHDSYSKKLLWPRVSTAFIYGFKPDYSEDNLTKWQGHFFLMGIYLFIYP